MAIKLKSIPKQSMILLTVVCILFFDSVQGVQIPDIYWHPKNPMFNNSLCDESSTYIYAYENDIVNIVCPNRDLNDAVINTNTGRFDYSFNVYITDNYDLFEDRIIKNQNNSAQLLYTCKEELTMNSYGSFKATVNKRFLKFSPFGLGSSGVKFLKGRNYFLFTTADGTEESVKNEKCPRSTRHLALNIRICRKSEGCSYSWKRCMEKVKIGHYNRHSYDSGKDKTDEIWNTRDLLLFTFLALITGAFIGFFIAFIYTTRQKRHDSSKGSVETGISTISSSTQDSSDRESHSLIVPPMQKATTTDKATGVPPLQA